jgi:hypothetical protein
VEAFDGDAHEEDAHGDFAADGGEAVGDFAEPPVLQVRGLVCGAWERERIGMLVDCIPSSL